MPNIHRPFDYLHRVAEACSIVGDEGSILAGLYKSVPIDRRMVAACYLAPHRNGVKHRVGGRVVFPFGCNASQRKAVENAFARQLSIVQGPPGTGKTQTILTVIANALLRNQTVMVVSNNNAATANVLEKLRAYGLDWVVAPLGSRDNKGAFLQDQPLVPQEVDSWQLGFEEQTACLQRVEEAEERLGEAFQLENQLARWRQEHRALATEYRHFEKVHGNVRPAKKRFGKESSARCLQFWLQGEVVHSWMGRLHRLFLCWLYRFPMHNVLPLQRRYYQLRLAELSETIAQGEQRLASLDVKTLSTTLETHSLALLRAALYEHYHGHPRPHWPDIEAARREGLTFAWQYPVVMSTTFSARSCMFAHRLYDHLIIDEASQVAVETGALALTCAENAMIVGDEMQLPNVITAEQRVVLNEIWAQFSVDEGYNCATHSFLSSVTAVVKDAPQTLLREHYRCHPRIIDFCNQKFYGGGLLIMTPDKGEPDVLRAVLTREGQHAADHINRREIDVIAREVLPALGDEAEVGIVTPYNHQVDALRIALPGVDAGTIHKYQGREKDVVVMSVVDNQIGPFADDAHIINVAVSRAKRQFVLVMTGNAQAKKGNLTDLLGYIEYHGGTVSHSAVASIFDCLYKQYTALRMAFLENHPQVSAYASENLTYDMLCRVISSRREWSFMEVLCHVPLRALLADERLLTADQRRYADHYATHVDFLLVNRVTKKPVAAIETDGYAFHHEATRQHQRDQIKDQILKTYDLPLLRLSTKGSNEEEQVRALLSAIGI